MIALAVLLQETTTDFNDLGKLMLGGLAAAIIVAVAFTFLRLKVRERKPPTTGFISINSAQNDRQE